MTDRERIAANLESVRSRIAAAAARVGRDPAAVSLIAVTKYVKPEVVRLLHHSGGRDFGESTVQGAWAKRLALEDLEGARWHLLGHLQRNKVPRALQIAASIHSVDSTRLVREIAAEIRRQEVRPPAIHVEVNVARDPKKTGALPGEHVAVLEALRAEGLEATGLMAMAPGERDPEAARPVFRQLRELRDAAIREGLLGPGAGLSMGMSADFAVAVEEGATVVRIGSLLFEGVEEPLE